MEKYTIDSAIERLREITESLESGEYDLETSLRLYEEGVKLISYCNRTLLDAKQKITKLSELCGDDEFEE